MDTVTITRKFWFSYGHRVYLHEGQCANLHGHNATLYVTVRGPELDAQGRVIDFSVLKQKIDPWIQENWDHAMLWNSKDPVGKFLYGVGGYNGDNVLESPVQREIRQMKNYECQFNPTAEEMARYLAKYRIPRLLEGTQIEVVCVRIFETENCFATVKG